MMAAGRYYRITPRFWQDSDVRNEWTEDMRMLALYLMTSPHRNMVGLYYCPLSYMANDLQWSLKKVNISIDSLQVSDFVRYDASAQVAFLVNGLKHDSPSNPQQVKGAVKVHSALRYRLQCETKLIWNRYRMRGQTESIPNRYRIEYRTPYPVLRTPYP
jgi:hypothetical protein